MILSQGLKQVMTSLLLISFATQLLLKEGITTIPKLESSKYWDNKMVMLYGNSEFIITVHSEPNWKIDVWKTGGFPYFSQASTSPDMTQSADNINFITSRHMSTTVIHYNDVVHYAACRPKALKGMIKSRQMQVSTIPLWSTILSMMRRLSNIECIKTIVQNTIQITWYRYK